MALGRLFQLADGGQRRRLEDQVRVAGVDDQLVRNRYHEEVARRAQARIVDAVQETGLVEKPDPDQHRDRHPARVAHRGREQDARFAALQHRRGRAHARLLVAQRRLQPGRTVKVELAAAGQGRVFGQQGEIVEPDDEHAAIEGRIGALVLGYPGLQLRLPGYQFGREVAGKLPHQVQAPDQRVFNVEGDVAGDGCVLGHHQFRHLGLELGQDHQLAQQRGDAADRNAQRNKTELDSLQTGLQCAPPFYPLRQ